MTGETQPFPPRALILADAISLTIGDRQDAYGPPVESMARIAAIFSAITGKQISAFDAAMFHMATKLARLSQNHGHRDSAVDMAAYAAIAHECAMAERGD